MVILLLEALAVLIFAGLALAEYLYPKDEVKPERPRAAITGEEKSND